MGGGCRPHRDRTLKLRNVGRGGRGCLSELRKVSCPASGDLRCIGLLFFWEDLTPKAEVLTAFSDEGVRGRGVCRDFASES